MKFNEAVRQVINLQPYGRTLPLESRDHSIHFVHEERRITFNQLLELETYIRQSYPQLSFVVYQSNQDDENDYEIELVIQEGERTFILYISLTDIEKYAILEAFLYVMHDSGLSKLKGAEKNSLYKTYPLLEDLLFDYIQAMPTYRLWFVTQNVKILKGDAS